MTTWWLALAAAGVAEEVPPTGDAATLADGPGVVLSVGTGTPDLLAPLPEVPVQPRVGLAGFLEPSDALLTGVRVGSASQIDTDGLAPGLEAALAVAVGSRQRTVWAGGEAGVTMTPTAEAAALAAATFGVDVDPLSSLGFRLGLVAGPNGIEQRHSFLAMYRPADRTGISAGVHGGVTDGVHALAAQVAVHQRLGPTKEGWTEPVIVKEAEVDVDVHEHPELQCADGDLPTGRPPPLGLEGWCVRVTLDGHLTRHGPYLRWHDMLVIAERGAYTDGRRSGTWERYDHESNLLERGAFVADLEEGHWSTFYANGSVREEGAMQAGERTGRWRFYDAEGRLDVDGTYANGLRVGVWTDYDDTGTAVRKRRYEGGRMMSEERLVVPIEDDAPEVLGVTPQPGTTTP